MTEAFSLMFWPLLASFVLVGIHAYLGIHVIARKVIFVDLALAQIAALGAVYGVFIGLSFSADYWLIKAVSIAFTMIGAVVFSFTRTPDDRIPHEAIIGIIYAAALSMTLILTASLAHGSEEISQLLSGNILWVTPTEVLSTALLYAVVGVIHFVFRRQFFMLSTGDVTKLGNALNVRLWDFLFYATFGVVVTSSVGIGGVLLVFAYLVIPSVIGIMLARSTRARLIIAWASGLLMSFCGVSLSYFLDLPSGPTIVVLLAFLLLFIALVLELKDPSRRKRGLFHLIVVVLLMAVMAVIPLVFVRTEGHQDDHVLMHHQERNEDILMEAKECLASDDDKKRVLAIEKLKALGDMRAISMLQAAAVREQDPFIIIDIALALLSLHDTEGLFLLQRIMIEKKSDLAKEDAYLHLKEWLIDGPLDQEELILWLTTHKHSIKFDKEKNKFLRTPN